MNKTINTIKINEDYMLNSLKYSFFNGSLEGDVYKRQDNQLTLIMISHHIQEEIKQQLTECVELKV